MGLRGSATDTRDIPRALLSQSLRLCRAEIINRWSRGARGGRGPSLASLVALRCLSVLLRVPHFFFFNYATFLYRTQSQIFSRDYIRVLMKSNKNQNQIYSYFFSIQIYTKVSRWIDANRTELFRGTIVYRTYAGLHKSLFSYLVPVFTHNIWPYLLRSPVIVLLGVR